MGRDVCRVIVLGSTGSIGTQTLDVIAHLNDLHSRGLCARRFEVVALAAGANDRLLELQAARLSVRHTALCLSPKPGEPALAPLAIGPIATAPGIGSAERLVREVECDLVVAAISGIAGLPATLAAVELGRTIALANKETLVAAGSIVTAAARKSGARLLPVDSEHSGVWQCLGSRVAPPLTLGPEVSRVTLTASGGPFRTWSRAQMERATVEDALKHPTWKMGRKVTIDSATLMNKALEVVEAHWLFGVPGEKIGVLIHPQSYVHAMVTFADGSTVSQMGRPSMKTPIQHALTWPDRCAAPEPENGRTPSLTFEEPDLDRFPALSLAYRALDAGGTAGSLMNAAAEAAVQAFLAGRVRFTQIAELAQQTMDSIPVQNADSLEQVLEADRSARARVQELL